jgi:putative membrane protein
MLFLISLSVLLLAVVIFALQNAQAVTIRFLLWEVQSSAAVVALVATAAGVLIAKLFGLASRLLRWKRAARDGSGASGSAPR